MIIVELKRTVEYSKNHVPCMRDQLSDEDIEKSANKIMLLHKDDYYYTCCNCIDITDVLIVKV